MTTAKFLPARTAQFSVCLGNEQLHSVCAWQGALTLVCHHKQALCTDQMSQHSMIFPDMLYMHGLCVLMCTQGTVSLPGTK